MYNRYIPDSNGIYEKQLVDDHQPYEAVHPPLEVPIQPSAAAPAVQPAPFGMDLGDLLLLCIIVLIFLDADQEDLMPLLITIGAFILLP